MFCKPRPDKKIESMASLLILGGAVALAVALVAQYAFGLPPCEFCLLQRYPYGVAIVAGIASLLVKRGGGTWQFLAIVGALAFATTGALGLYHTGIEQGWVQYTGGCVADATATGSLDDLRAQILAAPAVSCSDAMARFAGLSMASWNALYAAGLLVLWLLQFRFDVKRHVR